MMNTMAFEINSCKFVITTNSLTFRDLKKKKKVLLNCIRIPEYFSVFFIQGKREN